MELDYNPLTCYFTVKVPRSSPHLQSLMDDYGLDFSMTDSTTNVAVLFTASPYAAATFANYATVRAKAQLDWILIEVEKSRALSSSRHIDVPAGQELAPFQVADLDYMLSRKRVLDADQPGLGKTPTAICFANETRAERVLVVCPASIRRQWCTKIVAWSTLNWSQKRALCMPIEQRAYGVPVNTEVPFTVVSYDLLHKEGLFEALMEQEWDLIIADEIHYAKEAGSLRSRALWGGGRDPRFRNGGLADRSERFVGLSGTPMPNRPREIWPVARHMHHDSIDFLGFEAFQDRFNPSEQRVVEKRDGTTAVVNDERSGRHAELQNRLRANFMVRHLKREVLTQLKLPKYDLIQVQETSAVRAALTAEKLLDIDPDKDLTDAFAAFDGHITTARRLMGEAIAPQVADWMKMLIEGGETKLVLFYWFIENGAIVERELMKYLSRHRLSIARVDGSTSASGKAAKIHKFINDPNCAVIMGNVLSLGTGTDGLQEVCNHALLMEPEWVHGNNEQCIDRLDRWGQKGTVQADIFVAPGSVAERVLGAALRKGMVTHNALDRRFA